VVPLTLYRTAARVVFADAVARGGRLARLAVEAGGAGLLLRYRLTGDARDGLAGALPPEVSTVAEAVVALADLLQEQLIEAGPDRSWPGCVPGHGHPPAARLVSGTPVWACDRTGAVAGPIGPGVTA
jgi:hypothetical protein